MKHNFVLGAVAYAPKVVTIWEGFKAYFNEHDFSFDYLLFSNYEAQNEALFSGIIHAAWNSPLAWVRAERMGRALGTPVSFGPMRDSDQDLTSVLVAKKNAAIVKIADLEAKTIGFGAYDSPQARLIPLHHLQKVGLKNFKSRCFDVLGGKHGDHIGGERLAAIALMQNEVDACWMIDSNYQAFSSDGTLTAGETQIIATTAVYDHCIFTMAPGVTTDSALHSVSQRFTELLMAMQWSDPKVRHLLELEGLKEWKPGRTQGFQQLSSAVDEQSFYDLREKSLSRIIDIEDLGFDSGAHILIKQGLAAVAPGQDIEIRGQAAEWQTQTAAWCRTQGHGFQRVDDRAFIRKGSADKQRWITTSTSATETMDIASPGLGLAARGACVEIGSPEFKFRWDRRDEIGTSNAAELYQNAINAQWNPNIAVDWSQPQEHSDLLETAVVQLLTYMVENENAALIVPARFLGQVHPHFREIQALLSIQIADEARHIDVFSRRIALFGRTPGLSTAGGQSSLKTLLDESQFGISEFLLSVLGEGTFVNLLQFLRRFAPDQATKKIALLVAKDESRHVAFGMSHLAERLESDPDYRSKLMAAVRARYDSLAATAGLNEEVFDSLIILAAGSLSPDCIAAGFKDVQNLLRDMEEGRLYRVERLGFSNAEAKEISSLHTRNFM